MFVSTHDGVVTVLFAGEHGLPPGRKISAELIERLRRSDYTRCNAAHCGSIREMSYLAGMYRRAIRMSENESYGALTFGVTSENERIRELLCAVFGKSRTDPALRPLFIVAADGGSLSVRDARDRIIAHPLLLTLAARSALEEGRDICVPYDAPQAITDAGEAARRHVLRFCDEDDLQSDDARRLAEECVWVRDGLFLCTKLLDLCASTGKALTSLLREDRPFAVYERSMAVPGGRDATGGILGELGRQRRNIGAGIRLFYDKGNVFLSATDNGARLRIIAEAADAETAAELCGEVQEQIRQMEKS